MVFSAGPSLGLLEQPETESVTNEQAHRARESVVHLKYEHRGDA